MSKTKRAKVVRAWAVVDTRKGVVRIIFSAKKHADAQAKWWNGFGRSNIVVPLTGTLPHKKGSKNGQG